MKDSHCTLLSEVFKLSCIKCNYENKINKKLTAWKVICKEQLNLEDNDIEKNTTVIYLSKR